MIFGHRTIRMYLERSRKRERLSHAYLFLGPQGVGKTMVAREFIRAIHCRKGSSPCGSCSSCSALSRGLFFDTREIVATAQNPVGIDEVRSINRFLSLASAESGGFRTVLIDNAEYMTSEAAHALLKTLEEPRGNTVFILVTSSSGRLPRTIHSRCETIRFGLVSAGEITAGLRGLGATVEEAKRIRDAALGKPSIARRLLEDRGYRETRERIEKRVETLSGSSLIDRFLFAQKLSEDPDETNEFLTGLTFFFRDMLREGEGNSRRLALSGLSRVRETEKILSRLSANRRLTLEVLMLHLP